MSKTAPHMAERPRLGILISGSGTTMEAILKACQEGQLDMEPTCIISSKDGAAGIARAEALGFERGRDIFIVSTAYFKENGQVNKAAWAKALLGRLEEKRVTFVSQNGWLPYTPNDVIDAFEGRIINQHPAALDPKHEDHLGRRLDFGGEGIYGGRAVCATVIYHWLTGDQTPTESSVHHVTEKPDGGQLIHTNTYWHPAFNNRANLSDIQDNPNQIIHATQAVQDDLLPVEHRTVIETLAMMAKGENPSVARDLPLVPERFADQLYQARKLAISLFPHG